MNRHHINSKMAKVTLVALLVIFCLTNLVVSKDRESFHGHPRTLNFLKESPRENTRNWLSLSGLEESQILDGALVSPQSTGSRSREETSVIPEHPREEGDSDNADSVSLDQKFKKKIPENPWEEENSADAESVSLDQKFKNEIHELPREEANSASTESASLDHKFKNLSTHISQNTDAADSTEVQIVLDLLKKGEEIVKSGVQQDVIITMGNTGAGKSTFTQFITGNDENLISVERTQDSGEFTIQDVSGKISNTTWTSWTVLPELVVDKKTNTKFYDCPGFSDTRGIAHDIASTYFTKEAIKNTERIKLIFFVNYPAVRIGVDRQDFMLFAHHATTVVKNIDKFKDSIALIVTKVDNNYRKGNLVSDKIVIETVANFLREVKDELQKKMSSTGNYTTKDSETKILKFIDILLVKVGDDYPRIGIFRRPDESGPISQISLLQEGKKSLEKIIHVNTKYVTHEENDFDYTLSAESKNRIHDIVETIKDNIASAVSSLVKEIEVLFASREESINDVEELHDLFQYAHKLFIVAEENTVRPQDVVKLVTENTRTLNMSTPTESLSDLTRFDRYLEILESFGARVIKPSEWNPELITFSQYLEESRNWYGFLTEFVLVLSKYNVQRNKEDFVGLAENFVLLMEASKNYSKESHENMKEQFQERFGRNSEIEYDKVKYSGELSNVKVAKLKSVIDFALKSEVSMFCDEKSYDFVAKGQFVKLSDVSMTLEKSCKGVKFIEIFALETVFIDGDLDLTDEEAQVTVIAPTWDVVGSHKIILEGGPGQAFPGVKGIRTDGGRGMDGDPGRPGNPAGSFLGIGQKFIDSQNLSISVDGGRGGSGQDGTDGMQGVDGTTPTSRSDFDWSEAHSCKDVTNKGASAMRIGAAIAGVALGVIALFHPVAAVPGAALIGGAIGIEGTKYKECTVLGKQCGDGGNGGVGGAGGKGGKPGQIEVISLRDIPLISISALEAEYGTIGSGGDGGRAGYPGRAVEFFAENNGNPWSMYEINEWFLSFCDAGDRGMSGENAQGLQEPKESKGLVHPSEIVRKFGTFAAEKLNKTVRQTYLRQFLSEQLVNVKIGGWN